MSYCCKSGDMTQSIIHELLTGQSRWQLTLFGAFKKPIGLMTVVNITFSHCVLAINSCNEGFCELEPFQLRNLMINQLSSHLTDC